MKTDNKKQKPKNKVLNKGGLSKNKKIGDLGEDIAVIFLEKRGFQVIDRNYRKKTGEIDIVAHKDGFYYVIEVKTLKISVDKGVSDNGLFKDKSPFNGDVAVIRDGEKSDWSKSDSSFIDNDIKKFKSLALMYCMEFDLKEETLKFLSICVNLYHSGSRVTKGNLVSCKVKVEPLSV